MATVATTEENGVCSDSYKQTFFQNWLQNSPKLAFGEHKVLFELDGEEDEFFIQKAREELRETPEIVELGFKELRELIAADPDLYVPEDKDIYLTFLRSCKWYANSAFSLMKRYFQFRLNYPHIYTDLVPSKETIGLCSGIIYPLPLRTMEGCRILVVEAGKRWKPKEVPLDNFFKTLIMLLYLTREPKTQISGVHIILDLDGLTLSHLTYVTPSWAKMLVEFIQRCLPARLKGIHIVKQSFIFNIGFAIFKPFLEEKIRKRIITHGTDWESLMKSSCTDKSMLLMKHGGKLEMPDESLGMILWQNMLYLEPFMEVEQKYGYRTVKDKK